MWKSEPQRRVTANSHPRKTVTSPSMLDVLIIVSVAIFADFIMIWVGSRIANLQVLENLAPWITDIGGAVRDGLGALSATAVLALAKQFLTKTTYLHYLRDTLVAAVLLLAGVIFMAFCLPRMSHATPSPGVVHLNLRMKLPYTDGRELTVERETPLDRPPDARTTIARQVDEDFPYKEDVFVPQLGNYVADIFSAHTSAVREQKDIDTDYRPDYEVCLRYNALKKQSLEEVHLNCSPGKFQCGLDSSDPGWVSTCDANQPNQRSSAPHDVVYAAERPSGTSSVWIAPTLETLRSLPLEKRPGYTNFAIQYSPSDRMKSATYLTYRVSANGTPVYFDKIPTDLLRESVERNGPTTFSFALENLNFSGSSRGEETISMQIGLFGPGSPAYQTISRQYVALRPGKDVSIPTELGTFKWSADYQNPSQRNRWEVFVNSTPEPKDADLLKRRFDHLHLSKDGLPVVLIERPPLTSSSIHKSTYFGLALGIEQPTGQVQFSFDDSESRDMCIWASQHEATVPFIHKHDSRRETIDTQQVQFCRAFK